MLLNPETNFERKKFQKISEILSETYQIFKLLPIENDLFMALFRLYLDRRRFPDNPNGGKIDSKVQLWFFELKNRRELFISGLFTEPRRSLLEKRQKEALAVHIHCKETVVVLPQFSNFLVLIFTSLAIFGFSE